MWRPLPVWSALLVAIAAPCASTQTPAPQPERGEAFPQRINAQHLPNAIRVTEKVISGGLPEDEAAFAELSKLGVKTIISVDAARPNAALAKRFGLRYVHLPHGYDGISAERTQELAKAVRDLPGPLYLHCHHGRHRSPAAAAAACVSAGLLPSAQAVPLLKFAGTSTQYEGLYASAAAARPLAKEALDRLPVQFSELAKLPPLAEAMSELEHNFDHLQQLAANGWQPLAKHPALQPAHEALLLREHYTEMLRGESPLLKKADFRRQLEAAESTARTLETALIAFARRSESVAQLKAAEAALTQAAQQCKSCHATFRDKPLRTPPPQP